MLDPAFIKANFALGEISQLYHVIGERMKVTPMISLDSVEYLPGVYRVFTVLDIHYFEPY